MSTDSPLTPISTCEHYNFANSLKYGYCIVEKIDQILDIIVIGLISYQLFFIYLYVYKIKLNDTRVWILFLAFYSSIYNFIFYALLDYYSRPHYDFIIEFNFVWSQGKFQPCEIFKTSCSIAKYCSIKTHPFFCK